MLRNTLTKKLLKLTWALKHSTKESSQWLSCHWGCYT